MCCILDMDRIGVRELRQHASRCLERVKAGQTVEMAISIRAELSAFVAYDQRLADAASAAGLELVRPGA
jgi:hypothetical protein